MGIKYIHVTLIVVSILLCLGFGAWTLSHNETLWALGSFAAAVGLTMYLAQFVKKMKAL